VRDRLAYALLRLLRDRTEALTLDEIERELAEAQGGGRSETSLSYATQDALSARSLRRLVELGLVERHSSAPAWGTVMPWSRPPVETYRAHPNVPELLAFFGLSLRRLIDDPHEVERLELERVRKEVERTLPVGPVRDDLTLTLREVASCLEARAHLGCMALVGRALEVVLRDTLARQGLEPTKEAPGLRSLITDVKKAGLLLENEPALVAQLVIIDGFRNPAVHVRTRVPSPSADQAAIVVRSLCDLTRRLTLTG
jgi:hypothetical protein